MSGKIPKIDRVQFVWFFPEVPSNNYMFMLEAMTYKVCIDIPKDTGLKHSDIVVQSWNNGYDKDHNDGKWHGLDLKYMQKEEGSKTQHIYGISDIITSATDFKFTFRMRRSKYPDTEENWRWSHGYQEDGFVHVEPPHQYDSWTQGPDFTQILGRVYLGNFIAATNAKDCEFTHVLNVADNLDMVYDPQDEITYRKIPIIDGASHHIPDYQIKLCVDWLMDHDRPGKKILVNCRAGIGRAGSVALAYVFAKCAKMTYDEAYNFVSERRFVYPHFALKETLYKLFPRSSNSKSSSKSKSPTSSR